MLEANATAKDVLYLAKPDFVDGTMPKAKKKVGRPKKFDNRQLVFKMTKDAEPCHGCQEVTAATSGTQPPAVPGSGAAGGGGGSRQDSFATLRHPLSWTATK